MDKTYPLIVGSYTADMSYFCIYLGYEAAELAKYLYNKLDIDLHIHRPAVHVDYDSYDFITNHLGVSVYKTVTDNKGVAIALENDLHILNQAYAICKLWNRKKPTSKPRNHDVPLFLTTNQGDYFYIFFNTIEKKSIVVDGDCQEFQRCLNELSIPIIDWVFIYKWSKTSLNGVDILYNVFHNKEFPNEQFIFDSVIPAFDTLHCN